jgi:hypothetical protein
MLALYLIIFRITDLETALVDECDYGTLRNICKGRPVPEHLRAEVWQVKYCHLFGILIQCKYDFNLMF